MFKTLSRLMTARLAVLPLVAAGFLAAAPAHAEFRGGGIVHSFDGCASGGYADNFVDMVRARYRPGENYGGTSRVSLFTAWGGAQHFYVDVPFEPGPTRFRGRGTGIFGGTWSWNPRPRIRITDRRVVFPRNAEFAEADIIELRFRIVHWDGVEGCRATVDLSLHRR